MNALAKWRTGIFLLLILILAALFRFYGLKSTPPGLYVDEATNGNNAVEAIEKCRNFEISTCLSGFKVFYPENNGREGLFINIQALSVKIFGNEPWALRLVSAIFGTLTVLGMYLLTRELFQPPQNPKSEAPNPKQYPNSNDQNSKRGVSFWVLSLFRASKLEIRDYEAAPLLAAFFVATSFWHINFSRIGFRAISAPFFLVFGFYFLLKAFNTIKSNSLSPIPYPLYPILSGLFFGLGFHTYIAYRILPLLLAIILWLQWRTVEPQNKKRFLIALCVLSFVMLIVVAPLGLYFLENPGSFFGRASQVSVLKKPLDISLRNIGLTLGMFHVYGDGEWRHNFAFHPLLWWPVGIFFLVGTVVAFRTRRYTLSPMPYTLPLWWFGIMMIPHLLAPDGNPHALRALIALPAVFIIAAMGAIWTGQKLRSFLAASLRKHHAVVLSALVASFLVLHIGATEKKYFLDWALRPETADAFSANYVEEARILRALPPSMPKYVIVNYGWHDVIVRDMPSSAQTVIFLIGGWDKTRWAERNIHLIRNEELQTFAIPGGSFLVPLQKNIETSWHIKNRWPSALELPFRYFTAYRL